MSIFALSPPLLAEHWSQSFTQKNINVRRRHPLSVGKSYDHNSVSPVVVNQPAVQSFPLFYIFVMFRFLFVFPPIAACQLKLTVQWILWKELVLALTGYSLGNPSCLWSCSADTMLLDMTTNICIFSLIGFLVGLGHQ